MILLKKEIEFIKKMNEMEKIYIEIIWMKGTAALFWEAHARQFVHIKWNNSLTHILANVLRNIGYRVIYDSRYSFL